MNSDSYAERISGDSFAKWYREREWARNVRQGQSYFNSPDNVPAAERHTPSSLLQCHRKVYYRQENAPPEQKKPEGIFWTGRHFEQDVILPYLRDLVHGDDVYVRDAIWIDFKDETDAVRWKGMTDPCIVDRQSEPLLPTEVKTKEEVTHLDGPNRHHKAQVHAYMRGLSAKYDRDIENAVIIYGSRKTMAVRTFHVEFDPEFWEGVVGWATTHTEYRDTGELPPADPEYGWECNYCDYRHRCGQSDQPYRDEEPHGLLPGIADYPREQIVAYLRANNQEKLTPTLATEYPDLADEYGVYQWHCPRCNQQFEQDHVTQNGRQSDQPVCPACAEKDTLSTLVFPGLQ